MTAKDSDPVRTLIERWRERLPQENPQRYPLLNRCIHELEAALAAVETPQAPSEDLMDSLHAVFTRHGIASRSDLPHALMSDLVGWAARKCREAQSSNLNWVRAQRDVAEAKLATQRTSLPDDALREIWRSVQGPHAELTGPLIRFAAKIRARETPPAQEKKP